MADGGTLFLDEIGDMPLDQQAILLRVLQGKRVTRIGGDHAIPVDVRVICATHKHLKQEVERGNFRADLYYRLNVILVTVPPLRERPGDVSLLFFHLLKKICRRQGMPLPEVPGGVISRLGRYPWPGNVRELENVVEKLVNASRQGRLSAKDLPVEFWAQGGPVPELPSESFSREDEGDGISGLMAERDILVRLLDLHRGNVSQVARDMKVSRNTVYRKLRFYRISRERSFE